jgi:hypothetical protein
VLRSLPTTGIGTRSFLSRWDAAAMLVVFGLLAFLGEASHGLLEPLAKLEATPPHRARDPRHEPVRPGYQSPILAASVSLRGTQVPPGLNPQVPKAR